MSIRIEDDTFVFFKSTVLAAGAEVIALVSLANSAKSSVIRRIIVSSTVATAFTLERLGVFTSGTPITAVALNPANPQLTTCADLGYSGSTISTVNTIATINCPANDVREFPIQDMIQLPAGILDTLAIRTNSVTGTVTVTIILAERN